MDCLCSFGGRSTHHRPVHQWDVGWDRADGRVSHRSVVCFSPGIQITADDSFWLYCLDGGVAGGNWYKENLGIGLNNLIEKKDPKGPRNL